MGDHKINHSPFERRQIMEEKPVAFVSCRFVPEKVVDAICDLLKPEIECKIATLLWLQPILPKILEEIKHSDLLISIITKERGDSAWIQNELGMAYALGKPILPFFEEGINSEGFAPLVGEYITFNQENLAELIKDSDRIIKGIKIAVVEQRDRYRQHAAQLMALEDQKHLGIIGVYPNRNEAFSDFREFWNREENEICIVGSTLEGFRIFAGDEGIELIDEKINEKCQIKVLLTHIDYLGLRAKNEKKTEELLEAQLKQTLVQLNELLPSEYLEVRWFKSPPTCFLLATKSQMLLNPYPYMRTANWSFAMIVQPTNIDNDIFHTYNRYHFREAWNKADAIDLRTFEAILQRKKSRNRREKEKNKELIARFRNHTLDEQELNQAIEDAIKEVRNANPRVPSNA
jgi:nucleoside 2-deoxyribosyltransferase